MYLKPLGKPTQDWSCRINPRSMESEIYKQSLTANKLNKTSGAHKTSVFGKNGPKYICVASFLEVFKRIYEQGIGNKGQLPSSVG